MIFALVRNFVELLLLPFLLIRRSRVSRTGGYVSLEIDGAVTDLPPRSRSFSWLRRRKSHPLSVTRARELARSLAADPKVAGLLVTVRRIAAGHGVVSSLRDVLSEVRAAGKDVVVYLPNGADNRALTLASAARLVIAGPQATIAPLGYAMEGRYVRRALERVGVEPEVFAKGEYKSAGEVLVRDTMSDAQREQVGALLETHYAALVDGLARGRKVDRETAASWVAGAPYSAERAAELGIVDAVGYEDELERIIGSASYVAADRYLRARSRPRFSPLRPPGVIGVVEVHGPIVSDGRFSIGPLASDETVVASLRAARANPRVRGVIVHIDSPGGSAIASDRIYHEVTRVAEIKPVVAYVSNVAASGGYFAASGAHVVIAQPQAITGSIGVVSARFVVGPLLERLGVFTQVVKRGERADLFSPARHLDEAERALFERELDAIYSTFLRAVARGRRKTVAEIEPLAGGRVYSGVEAHGCGLVDHLGGFDRAVHEVRDLLGPGTPHLPVRYVRTKHPLPPPAPLPTAALAMVEALGLGPLAERALLALNTRGERALVYLDLTTSSS